MTLTLSFVLMVLAILLWIVTLARRSRAPFVVEVIDAVFLLLLAFYFR